MNNDPEIKGIQEKINNNKQARQFAEIKVKELSEELVELQRKVEVKEQEIANSRNTFQICNTNIASLNAKLKVKQNNLQAAVKEKISTVLTKINNVLRLDPPGHPLSCQFLDSENAFQVLYSEPGKEVLIVGDIRQNQAGTFNIHKVSNCRDNFQATAYYMQKINLIFNQIKGSF